MSRVLVTGASGFIGAAAVRALASTEHEVHAVSSRVVRDDPSITWHVADLLDGDVSGELIETLRPELLLHLAWYAEHGRFWTSLENVRWVEATLRLFRSFAAHGGRRAVVAGTCAEYQWGVGDGVCHEQSTPLRPATLYGISKGSTRAVAEVFAQEVGLELGWGRVFHLYGPGEPATRLVPSVACGLLNGSEVSTSSGTQVRDFLHVEDVAGAFVALLDSAVTGPVNIGSGQGVTVRQVVEMVMGAVGGHGRLELGSEPLRSGEPPVLVADVRRLADEVGFRPRMSLQEGIAETVAWWRDALRAAPVVPVVPAVRP
jgi:nucleoside-diphosphate-sugar epimerase